MASGYHGFKGGESIINWKRLAFCGARLKLWFCRFFSNKD
jgi:hypothetical protein